MSGEFTPRQVLVTGGCGFIGSNFVRHLLRSDPQVRVVNLDALTYCGNPENLRDVEADFGVRYRFLHGDIRRHQDVAAAMAGCDGVVHFAAESHVDRSIVAAHDFITTNFEGTYVLLEEARRAGVERFLHISTDEVYGSTEVGSFTEEDRLHPSSPYSSSKAASDLLVLSYRTTFGSPVLITRSTNNFGPYQFPEKLIPLFVSNLLEGKPVPLYGDGLNVRDWLYVVDNCTGLETVLRRGEPGQIYNLGAGNEVSNRLITDTVLEVLGAGQDMVQYVTDRPGHDRRYSVATDKIRALGWSPARDFREALQETVNWYRLHQQWWRPLKDASTALSTERST
ncbi:MAG: dTDP-glucose 4,6-dehydratase [Gaiellales bacterium]|nr:dTDP-glucose 4,6-dehydratase [Gaiellales bacterium]